MTGPNRVKARLDKRLRRSARRTVPHKSAEDVPVPARQPIVPVAGGQAIRLGDVQLHRAQRQALVTRIGRVCGNRHLQRVIAPPRGIHHATRLVQGQEQSQATVQRRPGSVPLRTKLQRKYRITIEKGNKDWTSDEIKHLAWSLGKLSKAEGAALKGYRFIRWSTPAARQKVDPTYTRPSKAETGLHEATLAGKGKSSFKISIYDKAFEKSTTIANVPIGRFYILHEIGHAMEIAEQRRYWEDFKKAEDAYNSAVGKYNKDVATLSGTKRKRRLGKIKELEKRMKRKEKKYDASVNRTLKEFKKLVGRKQLQTPYFQQSKREAFADVFALNKIDPKGIKRAMKGVHTWLKRGGHLK